MKNKGMMFLLLIFIVSILSISAVSATDDFSNYINNDDSQEIILEGNINEDLPAIENQELNLEENIHQDDSNINADEKLGLDESAEKKLLENISENTEPKDGTNKVNEKAKTTAKASSKETTFKTISKGSKNKTLVKKIQRALKNNGYYLSYKGHYLKVDGIFKKYTFKAVQQFQKAKGLKVTGKVDEKTAIKLKIFKKKTKPKKKRINAEILFEDNETFVREYNSGYSFDVKIVKKSTGKGIATVLVVEYFRNGKERIEYYYTDKEGINYITPDNLEIGTYIAKVSPENPKIKAKTMTKKIIVKKTSIRIKAKSVSADNNQSVNLKATLRFKNNAKVNEGKVKFTIDDKSYVVKVKNGVAVKKLQKADLKSKEFKVEFLGTKNINVSSATGKIE